MAENKQKTKRDAFRERYAKRNPDLNMEDEDAYYDSVNRLMDDYEGYENASQRMRESIKGSPAFADMINAARGQENFDPILWAVENGRLDIEALQSDPEYAAKLAKAQQKAIEKKGKQADIDKEFEANFPDSMESIKAKAKQLGLDEEQMKNIIGQMYQMMDDMIVGKLNAGVFELLAKGNTHDADVQGAMEEGRAKGLSTKVDDKLRTLAKTSGTAAGRQTPMRERKPKEEPYNPFKA